MTRVGSKLLVQVRTSNGQLLTDATLGKLPTAIPVQYTGKVHVVWEEVDAAGKRLALGSGGVDLGTSPVLEIKELVAPYPRGRNIILEWAPISGKEDWLVEVGIYDAFRNRVRFASAPASAGQLAIPAWETREVSHAVHVVLTGANPLPDALVEGVERKQSYVRSDRWVLAEHTQWLHIEPDPDADKKQFTVLAWGDERGGLATRWRGLRMRKLGLNAAATIGNVSHKNFWASASGLRIVPTNVYNPTGRQPVEQRNEWFTESSTNLSPLSPLGYSFADEPKGDVVGWLESGAAIISKTDPGTRVGYCGVWPGKTTGALFANSGYLGMYSPQHLYTPNLWLGIERDIYRSFLRPETIVTCWTHYAPIKDHEPYSRTVPWMWLLDGLDGIGYFKSAGLQFGILDGDMSSTHETRWWSEEVLELNAGIARQVKRMERPDGEVRILFREHDNRVEPWARYLNDHAIPYKFLDAHNVTAADLAGVKLLIAIDGTEMNPAIEGFVRQGGWIVCGGGVASLQEGGDSRFAQIFGFKPEDMAADVESEFRGIGVSVRLGNILLEGRTTGEALPSTGGTALPWGQLGSGEAVPEALKTFEAAAAVRVGLESRAAYLSFVPDEESVYRWLPSLLAAAQVTLPKTRLLKPATNQPDTRIYLKHFTDGVGQLVGLVPAYVRIPPSRQISQIVENKNNNEGSAQKKQQEYFLHGKELWSPVQTQLVLDGKYHIYDVRKGQHFGQSSVGKLTLQPGRPELYALLPYGPPTVGISSSRTVAPGTDFQFVLQLRSEATKFANHVIRAELFDPQGQPVPGCSANIDLVDGKATGKFPVPHGAQPGSYLFLAKDVLTGSKTEAAVIVSAPAQVASAPLPPYEFRIERQPITGWPTGTWEPIPEEVEPSPDSTTVKVRELTNRRGRGGKYNGKQHLQGGFVIGNALREYHFNYYVCDDPTVFPSGPPQQVSPGSNLGMIKPRVNLWNRNGYFWVKLGERAQENLSAYEMVKLEDRSEGNTARVHAEWMMPTAQVEIDYAMLPNHEGLFTRLTLTPHEGKSLTHALVNLISYPAGFQRSAKPFFDIAQEHNEWLLMGDSVKDRAFYDSGMGSAGLLVIPDQWKTIRYAARPLLKAERPASHASRPWQFHLVTWQFPERSNATAKAYMQQNSEPTTKLLREVFGGG